MLVRLIDRGEARRTVVYVEREGKDAIAILGCKVPVSRAVAATRSPRSSATIVHSRPNPRDVPVMNHVLLAMLIRLLDRASVLSGFCG